MAWLGGVVSSAIVCLLLLHRRESTASAQAPMLDASLLGGLAGNLGGGAGAGDLSSVIECTVGTSGQLRGLCVPAMLVPIVCEPLGFKAAAQNRTCDDQSVCCYADVEEISANGATPTTTTTTQSPVVVHKASDRPKVHAGSVRLCSVEGNPGLCIDRQMVLDVCVGGGYRIGQGGCSTGTVCCWVNEETSGALPARPSKPTTTTERSDLRVPSLESAFKLFPQLIPSKNSGTVSFRTTAPPTTTTARPPPTTLAPVVHEAPRPMPQSSSDTLQRLPQCRHRDGLCVRVDVADLVCPSLGFVVESRGHASSDCDSPRICCYQPSPIAPQPTPPQPTTARPAALSLLSLGAIGSSLADLTNAELVGVDMQGPLDGGLGVCDSGDSKQRGYCVPTMVALAVCPLFGRRIQWSGCSSGASSRAAVELAARVGTRQTSVCCIDPWPIGQATDKVRQRPLPLPPPPPPSVSLAQTAPKKRLPAIISVTAPSTTPKAAAASRTSSTPPPRTSASAPSVYHLASRDRHCGIKGRVEERMGRAALTGRQLAQWFRYGQRSQRQARLIGARATAIGEYCWHAVLVDPNSQPFCSGVLVSPSVVLTAAHCLRRFSAYDIRVRLGAHSASSSQDDAMLPRLYELAVHAAFTHPGFNSSSLEHNLALLKLAESVPLEEEPHVCIVCLPQQRRYEGAACEVSGFTRLKRGSSATTSDSLQALGMPVLRDDDCERKLLDSGRIRPDFRLNGHAFLCAGGLQRRDTCAGDGGGGLVCRVASGEYEVAGLVSWGVGCGIRDVPGVYTRVSSYTKWIEQMLERHP